MLRGDRVALRPATPGDLPRFAAIIAEPEVARWWGEQKEGDDLRDDFFAADVTSYAVEVDGELAGFIMCSEITDPQYRSAGIDIALATAWQGGGLGTDAVRTLARHLLEDRGHHRLTIDPAASNERAIASYRKAGFRPVGVMRSYERGSDGTWHDGLLMDMLAGELR
ncbi:MAG: GNAT family N-acetyltransferase [Candidatus Dormibacteraeota bacterium]|nr:GNAT family N-acetyltransferase [Candidatus Dormibacteraeota bacterium]MBV9524757.1 GNAT family N-acetyltransferase [Candidatus Dormibacteraeota bacterium]